MWWWFNLDLIWKPSAILICQQLGNEKINRESMKICFEKLVLLWFQPSPPDWALENICRSCASVPFSIFIKKSDMKMIVTLFSACLLWKRNVRSEATNSKTPSKIPFFFHDVICFWVETPQQLLEASLSLQFSPTTNYKCTCSNVNPKSLANGFLCCSFSFSLLLLCFWCCFELNDFEYGE